MLTLTPVAAEAIKGVVTSSGLAEEAGLRISSATEQAGYDVTVAALPAEDDTVVEEQGAHVFLESRAAEELDDKVLDAQVQDQGVSFALLQAD